MLVKTLSQRSATQNTVKIVIDKNFYRIDRQTVLMKKIAQNTAKTSLSKESRIEFLVKMYHAKVPSKAREKFRSQGKTVLKYSSWNFCPEISPKTPSTVSKHSSGQ